MPKFIPLKTGFKFGEREVGTKELIDMAVTYHSPQLPGLAYTDVLILEDFRDRVKEANDDKLGFIKLTDSEYNYLKRKVEDCKWPVFGPDVAQFIRDVRDAKDKPPPAPREAKEEPSKEATVGQPEATTQPQPQPQPHRAKRKRAV